MWSVKDQLWMSIHQLDTKFNSTRYNTYMHTCVKMFSYGMFCSIQYKTSPYREEMTNPVLLYIQLCLVGNFNIQISQPMVIQERSHFLNSWFVCLLHCMSVIQGTSWLQILRHREWQHADLRVECGVHRNRKYMEWPPKPRLLPQVLSAYNAPQYWYRWGLPRQ